MKAIKISMLVLAASLNLNASSALAASTMGSKKSSETGVLPKSEPAAEKPPEARSINLPISTKFNVFCAMMEPDKESPEKGGTICTLKLPLESTTAVCYPMPSSTEKEKGFACTVTKRR